MSSENKGPAEDEGVLEEGPGAAHTKFELMEGIMEKLKVLNYYTEFCVPLRMKPISRHYFVIPTNSGEQFYAFTSICAWLVRKCGKQFDPPQEYDDPNATISEIREHLQEFGHPMDFPPARLKTGSGEHCVYVLDKLSDEALKASNFSFARPIYPEEEFHQDVIDDEQEMKEPDDDAVLVADDSEDEEFHEDYMMDLQSIRPLGDIAVPMESSKPEEILESQVDATEWRLEVERVMPQLKVTMRTDNKDWRIHLDQMHQHRDGIEKALSETQSQLGKLHDDISATLEKISSREKYLNQQLENLLAQFRAVQDRLAETKERYRQGSGGVTERSRVLTEVTDELERIKQQMDEHGSSMTDNRPLVRIKQAIQKLKTEISQTDIRMGVVEHMLLQSKLRDRTSAGGGTNESIIIF